MKQIGKVEFGQYRVTFCMDAQDGNIVVYSYAEVFIPESAKHRGHWRLVTGKRRERVLAAARHAELRDGLK